MTAITGSAPSEQGIPFSRLVKIEIRKAIDTRSGFWLAFVVAGLCALILVLYAAGSLDKATDAEIFRNSLAPASALLPFVGILLVTSEFSARTALSTFVLVPSRWRVIAAKLAAVIAISAITVVAVALLAVVVGQISPDHQENGPGDTTLLTGMWRAALQLLIAVVGGFGFGLVLRNTPAAIVSYFLLPGFVLAALALTPGLDDAEPWIGQSSLEKLTEDGGITSTEWAQIATTSLVWLVLPLVLGLWRLNRAEIK